jgi:hypothetical protein
LDVTLDTA